MIRNWFPISAKGLHRKTILFSDRKCVGASLFPFFSPDGFVSHILLIVPSEGGIYLMPWHQDIPFRKSLRSIRLGLDFQVPNSLQPEDMDSLSRLLHYDPWWLLRLPAFHSHWAVASLKKTNCVPYFSEKVEMVYFSRDLLRGTHVLLKSEDETPGLIPWSNELLSVPEDRNFESAEWTTRPKTTWILDPIWALALPISKIRAGSNSCVAATRK